MEDVIFSILLTVGVVVVLVASAFFVPKWPFWLSTRQAYSAYDVLSGQYGKRKTWVIVGLALLLSLVLVLFVRSC